MILSEPIPSTLTEEAYRRLRADLIGGRLGPNVKLRFRELTARYGIGPSPLREALARLASERLVDFEPQRGFFVAPFSLEDLNDLCALRIELCCKALRASIQRGDDVWEAEILVATHLMERSTRPAASENQAVFDDWEARHDRFHRSLLAACGSPWLLRFCNVLSDQYQRYRRFVVAYKAESDAMWKQVRMHHKTIAETVLARDEDRAVELLKSHFEGSLGKLVELYNRAGMGTEESEAPRSSRKRVKPVLGRISR